MSAPDRSDVLPGASAAPLADRMDAALQRLAALADSPAIRALDGNELLMERAWLTGARFAHGCSTSGASRLLPTRDGVIAVTLARSDDWELVPAWLETDDPMLTEEISLLSRAFRDSVHREVRGAAEPAWQRLALALRQKKTRPLIAQGRTLGLPVAGTGRHRERTDPDFSSLFEPPVCTTDRHPPRVLDLSALWAGPLCGHLLHLSGAEVIKVESPGRPDGARAGHAGFHGLLNQGKRSVALDLSQQPGRQALKALIESVDIVIESSRPRALRQMNIIAEEILTRQPGLIWLSLTGYGRAGPGANWTAFGDDAGVAAGLSDAMREATGAYQFAADAIADPLTGTHAALAAWQAYAMHRGGLIELALTDVAAWCLTAARRGDAPETGKPTFIEQCRSWWHSVQRDSAPPEYKGRPRLNPVARLGADTETVLAELQSC